MKAGDRYLKFVRWSEEDGLYVGYCPDLFPWGGVCHSKDEGKAYRILAGLVREEVGERVASGKKLPPPLTRPMRGIELVPADLAPAGAVAA